MNNILLTLFIAPFKNITIADELSGLKIFPVKTNLKQTFDPFELINNRDRIFDLLYSTDFPPEQVNSLIGEMALDTFNESKLIAITRNPILKIDDFQNLNFLLLASLESYVFALWVVKDNSLDIDFAILFRENPPGILKNDSYVHNTNSKGQVVNTTYTALELEQSIGYFFVNIGSKERVSKITNEAHRIDISKYYIVLARRTDDLALKIAHYVTSLEALFSTVTIELSHTLSERIAFYIGGSNKKELYQQMKEAYRVRSVVAHGASFKEGLMDKLPLISENCDEICRKVFQKIHLNNDEYLRSSGKSEQIDNFFKDLIFR